MDAILKATGHRPWPLPENKWRWRQSWEDLAFIHYRVPYERLSQLIPKGIRLQEFDGSAWVGVVPFRMTKTGYRNLPGIPLLSSFGELNLRTYVEADGKAGVWFFSLDADSWQMVLGGRFGYGLPYFRASIQQEVNDGWYSFSSIRHKRGAPFTVHYRPKGDVFIAERGTFEHWCAERYCLYSLSARNRISRVEVHHVPWPLQHAEVVIGECGVLAAAQIVPTENPPICHFSTGVDVVSFAGAII